VVVAAIAASVSLTYWAVALRPTPVAGDLACTEQADGAPVPGDRCSGEVSLVPDVGGDQ
jgi:hypothetical protein